MSAGHAAYSSLGTLHEQCDTGFDNNIEANILLPSACVVVHV